MPIDFGHPYRKPGHKMFQPILKDVHIKNQRIKIFFPLVDLSFVWQNVDSLSIVGRRDVSSACVTVLILLRDKSKS